MEITYAINWLPPQGLIFSFHLCLRPNKCQVCLVFLASLFAKILNSIANREAGYLLGVNNNTHTAHAHHPEKEVKIIRHRMVFQETKDPISLFIMLALFKLRIVSLYETGETINYHIL